MSLIGKIIFEKLFPTIQLTLADIIYAGADPGLNLGCCKIFQKN